MTTVVISQPMYFPWPGFFEHLALADVLIWLDDVKFSRGSFTNRIQVKCGHEQKWMSIPIAEPKTAHEIRNLAAGKPDWKLSHRDLLQNSLRLRPHFRTALDLFDEALVGSRSLAADIIASAERLATALDVLPKRAMRSSTLGVDGAGSQRVLDLVRHVDGTRYVTGHGAAGYLDHHAFEASGIGVDYMTYDPLPWSQGEGPFTPYVTTLDLIASTGPLSRDHLQSKVVGWREFLASRGMAR